MVLLCEMRLENGCRIVRCTAHQHVGSKCMHVHNADNGDFICKSCPVYGTGGVGKPDFQAMMEAQHSSGSTCLVLYIAGEAGNENGYVVAINDDDVSM